MFGISVSVWDFYEFWGNYVRGCYVRENYVAPGTLAISSIIFDSTSPMKIAITTGLLPMKSL
jgi:hypothetical protein